MSSVVPFVMTMMSHPVDCPAASCGWILPKNPSFELIDSRYLTSMPVAAVNSSSDGYVTWPFTFALSM